MGDYLLNHFVFPSLTAGALGISALVLLIIWIPYIFRKIGALLPEPKNQYFRLRIQKDQKKYPFKDADVAKDFIYEWYDNKYEAEEAAKIFGITENSLESFWYTDAEVKEKGIKIFSLFSLGVGGGSSPGKSYTSGAGRKRKSSWLSNWIYTGPRGGRYRINSKGRKSYDVQ